MTTLEEEVSVEVETPTADQEKPKRKGRQRDLDFTKIRPAHQALADFVNARSGLEPVTGNQVKAIQTLYKDFSQSPEQLLAREDARKAREASKSRFAGMTPEQKEQVKAAEKAERQAVKLQARVDEALARAKAIREGTEGTGEDIIAAVEADQGNGGPDFSDDTGKRRFGRKK